MKRLLLFLCLISVLLRRGICDQLRRSISNQPDFVSRFGASRVRRGDDDHENDHDDEHDDHDDDHDDHDDDHDHGDEEGDTESWTRAKAFGYASLANAVISLLSLAGIAIVICNQKCITDKKSQILIFDFFIALGISTMLGDTFFHILPKVMGLHGHEEGSDEHGDHAGHSDEEDSHAEEEAKYKLALGRMALTVGMMYLFWILESLTSISNFGGHGHSHGPAPSALANNVLDVDDENLKRGEVEVPTQDTASIVGVAIGDVMHNFVDGIAIGVSWRFGWQLGMATTIAIFLHELPHELGDFAIYQNFGLSIWKALLLNLFSACCSFGGLFLGLSLAEKTEAGNWLLSATIGLFIYISLVNILPQLKLTSKTPNRWARFAVQNAGLLIGFIAMALLGAYEEAISDSLAS